MDSRYYSENHTTGTGGSGGENRGGEGRNGNPGVGSGMLDSTIPDVRSLSLEEQQQQYQEQERGYSPSQQSSPQPPISHKKKHAHAYYDLYSSSGNGLSEGNGMDWKQQQQQQAQQQQQQQRQQSPEYGISASLARSAGNYIGNSVRAFSSFTKSNNNIVAGNNSIRNTIAGDEYAVNASGVGVGADTGTGTGANSKSIRSYKNVDLVPSVVDDRAYAQQVLGPHPIFKTFENTSPPPAATDYEILDQGISGPNFARLTMYNVPATEQLRASTKLPLGMIITPFAYSSSSSGLSVPIADFTSIDPPRCRRCRAYINPSMMFSEGGTKFICNMCQFANQVSVDYFQPTDASNSNRRIDWQSRPELAFGTYDIAVPEEYWKNEHTKPSPLNHLFIIDVTMESVKKDLPKLAAEGIRTLLYGNRKVANEDYDSGLPSRTATAEGSLDRGRSGGGGNDNNGNDNDNDNGNDDSNSDTIENRGSFPTGGKIGIATFEKAIHFYNLKASLEQPQMIVMNDISDGFVPLEEGLFVDPLESQVVIEQLLDRIDLLFAENSNAEPAFGASLEVALQALEKTGGKVSAILSTLPTWGPGHLYFRESSQRNLETERDLYKPTSQYYVNLGKKYAQEGVGLDLFVFPSSYVDLANTGEVSRQSGGHIHYYPHFVPHRDGKKFIAELCRAGSREVGTQAQLKVRCSNGLQIAAYYGNMHHEEIMDDPVFGTVDSNTTIGVLFTYDGKLDTKLDAHFQAALLYTSSDGQRRVRVTNILTGVTEQFKPVMNFIDIDTCMGIISRELNTRVGQKPLKEIRLGLQERIIQVFAQYRKNAGSSLPPTLLLMPIALRGFIINCLSLQKSRALRDSSQVSSDARVNAINNINSMDADELSLYLYPRIVGLHNLNSEDCTYSGDDNNTNSNFIMPLNIKASFNSIEEGGVYLIYNGQILLIWIHQQVSPLLLQDLFGVQQLQDIDPYLNELPDIDTDVSRKSRALIDYYARRQSKVDFLAIQLARQGLDGAEHEVASMMVEDRIFDSQKYSDYVTYIHRQTKVLIEKGNE